MGGAIALPRATWIAALIISLAGTAWAEEGIGGGTAGTACRGMPAVAGTPFPSGPPGDERSAGPLLSTGTMREPAGGEENGEESEEALARGPENGPVTGVLLSAAVPDRGPGIRGRLKEGLEWLFPAFQDYGRETKPEIPLDTEDELVRKYVQLYSGASKAIIQVSLERCARYRDMVLGILREYQLPEELVYLPVIESYYNVHDLSRAGALGLWQLMPERARALGLTINCWIDERKDPEKSTRAAACYLKQLYALFHDWPLALAAYNRGEYGLIRDLKSAHCENLAQARSKKALPRETERYVPQFMACVLIARNPEKYGFKPSAGKPLRYDRVRLDRAVDLKVAAACAGTTIGELRELNPALRAWCTPYRRTGFELLVPAGTGRKFLANIAKITDPNPLSGYVKYRVGRGEDIEMIAARFRTTVDRIRKDNRLKGSVPIREDQTLVIRPGKECVEARVQY